MTVVVAILTIALTGTLACLCTTPVRGGTENCSLTTDDLPSSIDLSSLINGPVGEPSTTTLFLSNETLPCNGSVNVWRLCLSRNSIASGEETELSTVGRFYFGVWRLTDNVTYELRSDELDVAEPSSDFLLADVFCLRLEAKKPLDVISTDRVGVVSFGEQTLFSILTTEVGANETCEAVMGNMYITCNSSRYRFSLEVFQDDDYNDATLPPTYTTEASSVMGTEAVATSGPVVWYYVIVIAVLLVLLVLAVGIIVAMAVQLLRRSHRQKDFTMALPKVASPRYIANTDSNVLENKNHGDTDEEGSSNGRVSASSTNESTQLESVHHEMATPPIPLTSTFSYPPPASKAPLPPTEAIATSESEASPQSNVIQELNVRGLSEAQTELNKADVPHYPLKISASEPIVRSSSMEEKKNEEDALYEDVFDGKNSRKCYTPPVPAPRKAVLRKASSVKNDPVVSSTIASVLENKAQQIAEEKKKKEEKGDLTLATKKHDYVNVKHNVERLNSAPTGSDPAPVYAEPMITTNQRTRIMSCNPGISMTPPMSSSRKKTGPGRQRSVSGGDASPLLARVITNARSLEATSGSSPALDRIMENDIESSQGFVQPNVPSQPEEYLEPVFNKKNKT